MTLEQILTMIQESAPGDWSKITCWGGGGPSYLDQLSVWTSGDDRWGLEIESHVNRAVFRADVSLGLAWGLQADRDLHFEWAASFPDRRVSSFHADVLWNGMLVARERLLSVDGGRAVLPIGRPEMIGDGLANVEMFAETVPLRRKLFARLIHNLEPSGQDFDSYFERAGFVVADPPERA